MSKPAALFAIVALSALTFVAARHLRADESNEADKPDLVLGDKIALVYLKGRAVEFAFTLENAKIMNFHGKQMLSAVHADTGPDENWLKGRDVYIDWTSVESLVVFDSLDEYKKAIAEAEDQPL